MKASIKGLLAAHRRMSPARGYRTTNYRYEFACFRSARWKKNPKLPRRITGKVYENSVIEFRAGELPKPLKPLKPPLRRRTLLAIHLCTYATRINIISKIIIHPTTRCRIALWRNVNAFAARKVKCRCPPWLSLCVLLIAHMLIYNIYLSCIMCM